MVSVFSTARKVSQDEIEMWTY